jgi:CubicO group peptidase (beta-lactamase class C family)
MAGDTICRMGSMTKPIVAACAMTLVEDCTLRLDDPVDDLLPELADMTVLADPNGPLDDTVPAVAAGSSRPPTTTSPSPRLCSRAEPTTASGCSRGRR